MYAVGLDSGQRSVEPTSVELDIHVFAVEGGHSDQRYRFTKHTLVTLRSETIEAVELDGFAPQNALDDILIEELGSHVATASRISVSLPSNNGLGGSLRCEDIVVLAAVPFKPGPRSPYRDQ